MMKGLTYGIPPTLKYYYRYDTFCCLKNTIDYIASVVFYQF